MADFLQSTARRVILQAYLSSDHVTPATGKTIPVQISKNGGAYGNPNAGATNATEIANGSYYVDLDTTDTGTLGPLIVRGTEGTIDPIVSINQVILAVPVVNLTQIGGDAQSATDLKDFADAGYDPSTNKVQGVVLTDTVTTYTGNTPQTGDAFARLGAPAGASVSADVAAIKTDTAAILVDTGTTLPATLATIAGYIDTEIGTIITNQGIIDGKIDTLDTNLDALIADIGANGSGLTAVPWNSAWDAEVESEVTDALTAFDAVTNTDLDALPTAVENADALLDRDMASGSDSGSTTVRTVRQALRLLRNKWSVSSGTLTVCKEDDTTASWTSTVTGTAGADPVTSSDPAGP
jgi:hypothetical protein